MVFSFYFIFFDGRVKRVKTRLRTRLRLVFKKGERYTTTTNFLCSCAARLRGYRYRTLRGYRYRHRHRVRLADHERSSKRPRRVKAVTVLVCIN